jgi:hypothetical protein
MLMILLVAGCATKDPLQPTDVKRDIMPLKDGISWTYKLYIYNAPNPTPMDSLIYIVRISGTTVMDQETWFNSLHLLRQSGYTDDSSIYYYTLRDSGLCVRLSAANPVRLKVKAPGNVGTTFTGYNEFMAAYFFGETTVPGEIISTNAAISVPLGNYSCYQSRLNYAPGEAYYEEYYAYNVGMVRGELMVNYSDTYYPYLRFVLTGTSGL